MNQLPAEPIRLILPGVKNTQRLGSLVLISAVASDTRSSPVGDIADRYSQLVRSIMTVPEGHWDEVCKYLRQRNRLREYPQRMQSMRQVQVQDYLLADPTLPSGTGAEKEDARGAVQLASSLGVIWPESGQRSWRGNFILVSPAPDIIEAMKTGDREQNPFGLNVQQRMAFAWWFLQQDHTFLSYLTGQLLPAKRVTISNLMERIGATLPELAEQIATTAKTRADRELSMRLSEIARRTGRAGVGRRAERGGVTVQTLRREFEILLLWRLEFLVDLGYLTKTSTLSYEYVVSPPLSDLHIGLGEGASEFLASRFFDHWRSFMGLQGRRADAAMVRELLFEANSLVHNRMHYTLVEEGLLAANRIAMDRGYFIEFEDVLTAIATGTDEAYKLVSSVDKDRRLSAYKMTRKS